MRHIITFGGLLFLSMIFVSEAGDSEGCASNVFCGSMKDSGFYGNSRYCHPVKQWYHNAAAGKCLPFIFYGHGGNYNRFKTKKECEHRCRVNSKSYNRHKLCTKCPTPSNYFINVRSIGQNPEFFCNGNDCRCNRGKKCCPVNYSVIYGSRDGNGDGNDNGNGNSNGGENANIRIKRSANGDHNFGGFACLTPMKAPCENPIDLCHTKSVKRRNRQSRNYRKYRR